MKKVKGSMFVVSWFSDDEKIISEQGKVYGSRISKPQQVGLTAVIKYEAFKEKLRFNVIVTPAKKKRAQVQMSWINFFQMLWKKQKV